MTFYHWLGAEADEIACEHETQTQKAREVFEVDLGVLDHDE